jgi:hypothetical protein
MSLTSCLPWYSKFQQTTPGRPFFFDERKSRELDGEIRNELKKGEREKKHGITNSLRLQKFKIL